MGLWLENKFLQWKTDNYWTFWLETKFTQWKTDNYWTFWLETKFLQFKNWTTIGTFWLETTFSQLKADNNGTFWLETDSICVTKILVKVYSSQTFPNIDDCSILGLSCCLVLM